VLARERVSILFIGRRKPFTCSRSFLPVNQALHGSFSDFSVR